MSSKETIFIIKQQLEELRQGKSKRTHFMQKREELDIYISQLQAELSAAILKIHQETFETDRKLEGWEQQNKLLAEAKKKKQELDHFLDKVEDATDEQINQAEQKLIEALLVYLPDQRLIYTSMENEYSHTKQLLHHLKNLEQELQETLRQLREIFKTRQEIRRRGILRYIVGLSPNLLISMHLKKVEILSCKILDIILKMSSASLPESLLATLQHTTLILNHLIEVCRKKWGFKIIDVTLHDLHHSLEILWASYLQEIEKTEQFLMLQNQKITAWIEQTSSGL